MGFDVTNIPEIVRNENYFDSLENHSRQDDEIFMIVSLHKSGIGASGIYLYLEKKYPITSIRRSLNTLSKVDRQGKSKIVAIGKIKSQLYNSTETLYKMKVFQEGLF